MILELVIFKNPPGLARNKELEGARSVVAKWRANPDLLRKHFMRSEDGATGGAVYCGSRARLRKRRMGRTGARP